MTPEENLQGSPENNQDIEENKDVAASSYLLVFAPILFLTRKDSPFIQFHSAQGSILLLLGIIFWILGDLLFIFRWIDFAILLAAVVGFIQSVQGKKYDIPFISEIIKDGLSPQKIFTGTVRAFKIFTRIVIGFFPKKTGEKITEKLKIDPDKEILKRIENIEKVLLQEKFFLIAHSIPLSQLSEDSRKYFFHLIEVLKKIDPKMKIHSETVFYEISGSFGVVLLGGVQKKNPEIFSYAIGAPELFSPRESILFGIFKVGKAHIGAKILG